MSNLGKNKFIEKIKAYVKNQRSSLRAKFKKGASLRVPGTWS